MKGIIIHIYLLIGLTEVRESIDLQMTTLETGGTSFIVNKYWCEDIICYK